VRRLRPAAQAARGRGKPGVAARGLKKGANKQLGAKPKGGAPRNPGAPRAPGALQFAPGTLQVSISNSGAKVRLRCDAGRVHIHIRCIDVSIPLHATRR
jgi:hypothetical protein